MHLEFVVLGPPISNQQSLPQGIANRTVWKATVAGNASNHWGNAPLTGLLKALIINFHEGEKPSLDLDNMSKPILDAMQKIVFMNDRQVRQAELVHVEIGGVFAIRGVSKLIVNALQSGSEFVYVRIEDAVSPYPLPK